MSTQPEALRLADALDNPTILAGAIRHETAAELRRLHAENRLLHERHHGDNIEYTRVHAQRDALLEALKKMRTEYGEYACSVCDQADAAIKAAEEGK